jgi:hypothetical protein
MRLQGSASHLSRTINLHVFTAQIFLIVNSIFAIYTIDVGQRYKLQSTR